ncbi:hypothetical protein PF010_g967 [Phytophthora fragariae]|uniref:Uncharacterized protein n=1 Tax=Phytophthora fragariae TaxID=53985 RepID=A0A6G0M226_9STRA|nr:hypothetical protein PF010_g967 [Phytophthora fragariae]
MCRICPSSRPPDRRDLRYFRLIHLSNACIYSTVFYPSAFCYDSIVMYLESRLCPVGPRAAATPPLRPNPPPLA